MALCLPATAQAEFAEFDLVPVDGAGADIGPGARPSAGAGIGASPSGGTGAAAAAENGPPEAVVIGDLGDGWTFGVMNRAFRWLLDGAEFLVLHRNRYWKTGGELALDVGAFTAALEYATGREATLVGKPSRPMFEAAARSLGIELSDVAMVGDDLQADIAGSQALGCRAFLVRTGKFRAEELEGSTITPDRVLDSLAALPSVLFHR